MSHSAPYFYRIGRKIALFAMIGLFLPLSIGTCFAPDYTTYTVLRSINGLNFPALFQIPLIICLEILAPSSRPMAGMMISVFFALALMTLAGLAFLFDSWFHLELAISVPFVLLLGYWWVTSESPRWLLSQHRNKEALEAGYIFRHL